jgi:hypothetical protein
MQSATFADRVVTYWQKMGRLKLWSGVLGMQALQQTQQETQRNREAESRWARQKLWNETPDQAAASGEDMGHTFLGDVLMPQPQPPQQSNLLAGVLLGASLLGVPAAGVAGYLLNQQPANEAAQQTQETVDLGLLRFEDLEGIPE